MQHNGMSSIKYVWVILAPFYVVYDATEKQFA